MGMEQEIFTSDLQDHQRLEKYRRRVVTARTVVYFFSGIFICYYINVAVDRVGSDLPVTQGTYVRLLFLLALLAVNTASHYRPFVPLLVIAVVSAFFVASLAVIVLMNIFYGLGFGALTALSIVELMYGILVFFSIRGTVAAWKYQRLTAMVRSKASE